MAIPGRLAEWVLGMGLSTGDLSSLYSETELIDGTLDRALVEQFSLSADELPPYRDEFLRMVAADKAKGDVAVRVWAGMPTWQVAARIAKRAAAAEWADEEARYSRLRLGAKKVQATPPPPPTRTSAVTRRQREQDGDPQGRQHGEEAERQRWLGELTRLLDASGVALLNPEWDGLGRSSVVTLLAGGRRASTLRARARSWKAFQSYLRLTAGVTHPRTPYEALNYVLARASEPCAKSVLHNIKALFQFMDTVTGETPPIAKNRYVIAAFKEKIALAPARRDGDSCPASRFPVMMLALMEEALMHADTTPYVKVIYWWVLLSCWCTLRFDDHRGIDIGDFRVTEDGVSFELSRSKTTGADKSVKLRPGFLSGQAYIREKGWFEEGWSLYRDMAPFQRDYLLCVPSADQRTALHREIAHGEFTARMRGAIALLQVNGSHLGVEVAAHYTPHSGRNFLPSAVVGLGASEDDVRKLGAWSVRGGAAYVRTVREHTARLQETASRHIREAEGANDVIADRAAVEELAQHLRSHGVDEEAVTRVAESLTWSPVGPEDRRTGPFAKAPFVTDAASGGYSHTAGGASSAEAPSTDTVGVEPAEEADKVTGYVCSVIGRGRVRRLHYVGLCHRRPGHDYANYEVHGDAMPPPNMYDAVCRKCWPHGDPGTAVRAAGGESSVSTSDESSSSDSP